MEKNTTVGIAGIAIGLIMSVLPFAIPGTGIAFLLGLFYVVPFSVLYLVYSAGKNGAYAGLALGVIGTVLTVIAFTGTASGRGLVLPYEAMAGFIILLISSLALIVMRR